MRPPPAIRVKRTFLQFLRTTLVGGLTFLLPIVLAGWLIGEAMELATRLAQPALKLLPPSLAGGVVIGAIETAFALLIVAFFAGLVARTTLGQRLMMWMENSLIGSLPQFNFVRGVAESWDDSDDDRVEVVLVPASPGWSLGFVFEPGNGPYVPVFMPAAPQWTSGAVVFAERATLKPAGINFAQAMQILKTLGVGADEVTAALARA